MRKSQTLLIAVVTIAIAACIPSLVLAQQPYMGGYLRGDVAARKKVLVEANFVGTNPSQIPSDRWLGAVASVASSYDNPPLTPSGWICQSLIALFTDNNVYWAPQAWYGGEKTFYLYPYPLVGKGDYVSFYERMDIVAAPPIVLYRLYVYKDSSARANDNPNIYSWDHTRLSTGIGNFLVGCQLGPRNLWYKHFQFGVESNIAITQTAWKELNNHASFYDGTNWRYLPGYVTWGNTSAITWIGDTPYGVGGLLYAGVNKESSANDLVVWKYTGTTIPDDSQLWSGSGIVSDTVSKPYIP